MNNESKAGVIQPLIRASNAPKYNIKSLWSDVVKENSTNTN